MGAFGKYLGCASLLIVAATSVANAEDDQPGGVDEIIVTAQKREESVNSVGMSINAITADKLAESGLVDSADLVKLVPGFTYAQSAYTTPVYTLRGVGLYDAGLASSPAVTVYVDQVPLPYLVMTRGAALDVERVEVLKGPQGTLFGQNSTGGAINYIAARPTDQFSAGATFNYMRFGEIDASGYVSGPISDTLRARVAVRTNQGGNWQRSISRPEDKRGEAALTIGRLLLDWTPTSNLSVQFSLNGWIDKSNTQAPQLTAIQPGFPANASPELLASRIVPDDPRLAEWSTDWPDHTDDNFVQGSVRADYTLSDTLTLTSITAYSRQKVDRYNEADATPTSNLETRIHGHIHAFNQELRLAGDSDRVNWLIGGSYDRSTVNDTVDFRYPGLTLRVVGPPPLPELTGSIATTSQTIESKAVFGNLEYKLTDALSAQVGARYTRTTRDTFNCDYDPSGGVAPNFEYLQSVLNPAGSPIVPIAPEDCYLLYVDPADGLIKPTIEPWPEGLDEDNVSYRFGLSYTLAGGAMAYANYSRGWKSGLISNVSGSTLAAITPAPQERLDALEAGVKVPLANRAVQWNLAAFYYDYRHKQIRGRISDPIFGLLESLVSIPKSEIYGFETEIVARPIAGLSLSGGLTYLHSQITAPFNSFNQSGAAFDFEGARIPYTPKWQGVADAQYEWNMGGVGSFLGGSLTYHSADNATFTVPAAPAPDFAIDPYTLVDLRAGVSAPDDSWRIMLFGRNVTNAYYVTTGFNGSDTRYRLSGRPATWGIQLRVKTN